MSSLQSTATLTMSDALKCPLCSSIPCHPGKEFVCEGLKYHPPIRLSWKWNTFAEYEAMYESDAYHTVMQENEGQAAYPKMERYLSCQRQAIARLHLWTGLRGDEALRGRIIDIGAGNMAFVHTSQGEGCIAVGVDPHPLSDLCRKGTWRSVAGQYDLISLWDVFEHLVQPRECLLHLKSCLALGGMIAIETPEWNGPLHIKEGATWRHHRAEQHVCLFSKSAIEQLYEECGLEVVLFARPKCGTVGKMCHFLTRRD